MFETPQFVTGPWSRDAPVFLEDREYGLALDALVKATSDILVVSSDGLRVLLGRRKVEPQPDWWFIGGRSRPGDTTTLAASRNVRRELGVDFAEGRFEVVTNVSMVWARREQAPRENGTADLSTIHAIYLTEEEEVRGAPSLDPDEYHESRWWVIDDVIGKTGRFHPCLIYSLKCLRAKVAFRALEKATDASKDDQEDAVKKANLEEVAKMAVDFVKAVHTAKAAENSVKVVFDAENCKYVDQKKRKRVEEV